MIGITQHWLYPLRWSRRWEIASSIQHDDAENVAMVLDSVGIPSPGEREEKQVTLVGAVGCLRRISKVYQVHVFRTPALGRAFLLETLELRDPPPHFLLGASGRHHAGHESTELNKVQELNTGVLHNERSRLTSVHTPPNRRTQATPFLP